MNDSSDLITNASSISFSKDINDNICIEAISPSSLIITSLITANIVS